LKDKPTLPVQDVVERAVRRHGWAGSVASHAHLLARHLEEGRQQILEDIPCKHFCAVFHLYPGWNSLPASYRDSSFFTLHESTVSKHSCVEQSTVFQSRHGTMSELLLHVKIMIKQKKVSGCGKTRQLLAKRYCAQLWLFTPD